MRIAPVFRAGGDAAAMDGRRTPWIMLVANLVAVAVAWGLGGPRLALAAFAAENLAYAALLLLRLGSVYSRRRFLPAVSMGVSFALVGHVVATVASVAGLVPWLLQDPDVQRHLPALAAATGALLLGHVAAFVLDDVRGGQVHRVLPLSLVGAALGRLVLTLGLVGVAGLLHDPALPMAAVAALVAKAGAEAWSMQRFGASGAIRLRPVPA